MKIKFESELKKIPTTARSTHLLQVSIYCSPQQEKNQLVLEMEKHLVMAGIKTLIVQLDSIIIKKTTSDYSLYLFSEDLIELLKKINHNISIKESLNKLIKDNSKCKNYITIVRQTRSTIV